MKWIFALLLFCLPLLGPAQVSESFTDGDFRQSPRWIGDTSLFSVEGQQLKLSAPAQTGHAMLALENHALFATEWSFRIAMEFNTSSSNYARFYLVSDQSDLSAPLHGYFVQVGSTTDDVSLYRQTGTSVVRLIDGADGRINFSIVHAHIRVWTDEDGNWTLSVDTGPSGPSGNDVVEGSAQDITYTISHFAGLRCVYTATRSDKFRLDDVVINGQPFPDRIAPRVQTIGLPDSTVVHLEFSERMESASVTERSHYDLSLRMVNLDSTQTKADLWLAQPLRNGQRISFHVGELRDVAGNTMQDTVLTVTWLVPRVFQQGDLLINEIMADPYPPNELPDREYIEILNRSSSPVNLFGWRISDPSTTAEIPDCLLQPGGLVCLWPDGLMHQIPNSTVVPGLPALNNSGDVILLTDQQGRSIDRVAYDVGWHAVSQKEEGGWSLERIDPSNNCDDENNWTSSIAPAGGTPGLVNSVLADKPDLIGPILLAAEVHVDGTLNLEWNEPIDVSTFSGDRITIQPALEIDTVQWAADLKSLRVHFRDAPEAGMYHRIQVEGLRDCPGNLSDPAANARRFIRPHMPDSLDLVINEILFNPFPGGVDFVELFNRSPRFLNLDGWMISNGTPDSLRNEKILKLRLIPPGGYLVLTSDPEQLRLFYPGIPDSLVLSSALPSMPDDAGSIVLTAGGGKTVDAVYYQDDWHHPLIKSAEGFSLERLSAESSSEHADNWRSAGAGFGTPGQRNSCFIDPLGTGALVEAVPEVLENPTLDSFVLIRYDVPEDGLIGHVQIVDSEGHLVRLMSNNETLATSGFFRWDLQDDSGKAVRPGFYVVLMEIFNSEGYYRLFRRRIAIVP